MSKNLSEIIRGQIKNFSTLSADQYFKFRSAPPDIPVKLTVHGEEILVRKRTPDLAVAMDSLGDEFELLGRLFDRNYDGLIVDAGGYIGTAAIKFAKMYPQATIVTIEPSTLNLSILKKNIAKYPNIHPIQAALFVRSGETIKLTKGAGQGEWAFTIAQDSGDRAGMEDVEEIVTINLKDIRAQFSGKSIGILKLDIEGGEKVIFDEDAEELAGIPAVFAELHDRVVPGCAASFSKFSKGRWIVKTGGEKYLSLMGKGLA